MKNSLTWIFLPDHEFAQETATPTRGTQICVFGGDQYNSQDA
jgi:hypothetical protein